jgi:thymidylate synthase
MGMDKKIEQLIFDGREEEAVPLIEEVWQKRKKKEQKKIDNLKQLIDQLKTKHLQ